MHLREVAAAFEQLGMVTDVGLVGLDIVEGLMAIGRVNEVGPLASHTFNIFREARMLTGALTAIAYLKEAAETGSLTAAVVNTVRSFLKQAERQPELLFVRPPR
jgi:hypothetical protein